MMLESIVASMLAAWGVEAVKELLGAVRPRYDLDFVVQDKSGKNVGIEVKEKYPSSRSIDQIAAAIIQNSGILDKFVLVTKEHPSDADVRRLLSATCNAPIEVKWISARFLGPELGSGPETDIESPKIISDMQVNGLIKKIDCYKTKSDRDKYAGVPIGIPSDLESSIGYEAFSSAFFDSSSEGLKYKLSPDYIAKREEIRSLGRQFSAKIIALIEASGNRVKQELQIGMPIKNAFVLLSDIKSFSKLVRHGDGELIQELMSSYYRRIREAVWDCQGVLDKFIGDGTLAIWGYPYSSNFDASNAVRCAAKIVEIGRWLVESFQDKNNAIIESGTRVGIASHDLWPLNIGTESMELSFVGNALNLSNRLQMVCDIDGVLVDNRTKGSLVRTNGELWAQLNAAEARLTEEKVRGQDSEILAWQVSASSLAKVRLEY